MVEQTRDGAQSGNAYTGQQHTHPSTTAVFWFHITCVFQEILNQIIEGQEFSWQATGTKCDFALYCEIPSIGETEIATSLMRLALAQDVSHL